jgi:hypothetical protein
MYRNTQNNTKIRKLKFTDVMKGECESGLNSNPETVLQYLHIASTAVATVHIGKSMG